MSESTELITELITAQITEQIEEQRRVPCGVLRGGGCRVFRLQRDKAGLSKGDLLMVAPDAIPEGGEYVIDLEGRVCRHGGGPVLGVIVGVVRHRRSTGRRRRDIRP